MENLNIKVDVVNFFAMRKLLFFCLFGITLTACTDKAATLRERLAALNNEFGGSSVTDKLKAEEYITVAGQLADLVEKSAPDEYVEILIKAGGLAKTIGEPQKAIELYTKVTEKMPQHPQASTAYFMIGFIYANDLKDLGKGKAAFELFLEKYPNDEMAESARGELRNLGKSPEEVLKEFLQNSPDSSNAVQ